MTEAKESFEEWIARHAPICPPQGYRAPNIRRVYIPKPGKQEKRPLGVPCVADRALQRSAAQVLSAIYEQDFLPCSFGGRPDGVPIKRWQRCMRVIAGGKVEWVLEADLKNFFGSLSHEWMLRFVEHRVGDPRLISLIRRWLKAGILEDGELHANEEGTPQGGSISVLLSNVYLHYVLDLWFERVVKPRLRGEAYLVRYIDDFVMCFQYREDAVRVQEALAKTAEEIWPDPGTDARPNSSSLVDLRSDTRASVAVNARRRFIFWALLCTARAIGKATFGLGCGRRSHACDAALMRIAGPDAADAALVAPGANGSAQSNAAWPLCILRHCRERAGTCNGSIGPWSVTGARC